MPGGARSAALQAPARRASLALALCLALAAGAPAASRAAGLQLTPTTLSLRAQQSADGLWLINTGAQKLQAQARVFRWRQDNGSEHFEPTQALAVSPPMLELAPGARQLVRVVRTGPAPTAEESYRVIVDELPPAEGAPRPGGLQFVLRYSIPVFLEPPGDAPLAPRLRARLDLRAAPPRLEVDNQGDQHAQIADLAWVGADGQRREIAPGLLGYALAGQRMGWALPVPASALQGAGRFKARINGQATEQALALDPPVR